MYTQSFMTGAVSAPQKIKTTHPLWLTTGIQTITPAIATEMLATSIGNRNISKTEVKRLASLMTNGGWIYNGSPITFDCNGNLTNGHHRLNACVMSKASFKTLVAIGVDEESRNVDDTHRPKSAADLVAFSMPDSIKPYGERYMAGCATYMMYKNESGLMPHRTNVARFAHETGYSIVSPTLLLLLKSSTIARYSSLLIAFESIVRNAIDDKFNKDESTDYWHNINLLNGFVKSLIDGENIKSGSAVYALRERLLRNDLRITSPGFRVRFVRACIIAYNYHAISKPMSKVVVNIAQDRASNLDFVKPRIVAIGDNHA